MRKEVGSSALSTFSLPIMVFLLLGSFVLPSFNLSRSQAASPITPSGLNTQVTLSATPPAGKTQYDITGGTRPGGGANLFHSFGDFNVPNNNIANFLNETALPTSNILGRVTGGNISNIFGTIQTTGFGNANLFLMNPMGFLFGPNATVNVGGMVSFTSADYLRLADGVRFNAAPNAAADALLTAAPVAAFGFLGSNPGAITVQGSQLSVTPGQSLSLVGGNITVQSGVLDDGITVLPARLTAPGGQINLASVASPGEILAGTFEQAPNINGQTFGALGTIQISQKSFIDASGNSGGTVSIRGGQLVVNDSTITASTIDSASGPLPAGNGGAVTLSASDIRLENGSTIRTNSENTGNAGTITIQGVEGKGSAATNVVLDNATVSTTINGGTTASIPGAITITADTVTLNNGTYMTADTHGAAPAGAITFNVGTLITKGNGPIRLHVVPESLISNPIISKTGVLIESTSTSLDAGAGPGGQITIQGIHGPGSVAKNVDLNDTILHARVFGGTEATMPSAITITADSLVLSDQVEIYATSNGSAPAGNVALNVNTLRSNLNPDGSFFEGKPVLIGSPSEKFDSTAGPPGITTISGIGPESTDPAKLIALSNTELDTFVVSGHLPPPGQTPGPIIITSDTIALSNHTILVTTSAGDAPAGNIVLNANNLRVNTNPDGTPITTAQRVFLNSPGGGSGSTGGPAGTITISGVRPESTDPAKLVDLYNAQFSTGIEGGTAALTPGTLTITADTMNLSGGTHIFSFTDSAAPAGNVVINVNTLRANVNPDGTLINGQIFAQITSESIGTNSIPTPEGAVLISDVPGRAGTVRISGISPESTDPARLVALNNTRLSTLVVGGTAATNPATITVTADTVRLTNSPNITTETTGGAPAGHLTFNVNTLTVDQASKISSGTSGTGPGGTITIAAGQSVTLNHGSSISASSTGPGIAGDISINAGNTFASDAATVSSTAAQATGGNIAITAGQSVTLSNGASISASSTGAGNAGAIMINTGQNFISNNSSVTTQASQASGGTIKITTSPSGTVLLTNSTISASVLDGTGGGGSVNIDPQFVILQNSQILANAVRGPGGNISILTNLLFPDANSVISASSQFGVNGTVTVQSPNAPATGKITPLSQKPLTATALLSQRCAALASGEFSSFTVAGRDSLPAEPGGWLSSPLALATAESTDGPLTEPTSNRAPVGEPAGETPLLSLRQIAPPGFLTQAFAVDWSAGCSS